VSTEFISPLSPPRLTHLSAFSSSLPQCGWRSAPFCRTQIPFKSPPLSLSFFSSSSHYSLPTVGASSFLFGFSLFPHILMMTEVGAPPSFPDPQKDVKSPWFCRGLGRCWCVHLLPVVPIELLAATFRINGVFNFLNKSFEHLIF